MRRAFFVALFGLLVIFGSGLSSLARAAIVPVPPLTARVTDQTGTLDSASVQSLNATLAAFEQSKGSQIAVLIVPTTGDETIEQYSIRVTDAWKLGRKGIDDGALLLVAKDDHKVRIEVGRGLEGVIPDAIANRIVDEDITPKFHDGDFAGGVQLGVDRMIGLVNGEPLPPPQSQSQRGGSRNRGNNGGFAAIFVAFMMARAVFGSLPKLMRGGLIGVIVGVVAVIAGSAYGLALLFAFIAFVFGMLSGGGGGGRYAGGGGFGGWGGGSSGGGGFGGGGFSGGGGGFSGGGASGGW